MDLSDWKEAKDNAEIIYEKLKNKTMPSGGWPDAKIALFSDWIT